MTHAAAVPSAPRLSASPSDPLRVALVVDHASLCCGGEAARPIHYFRYLRRAGVDVRLVVHERCREELTRVLAGEEERIHYVPDTALQVWTDRLGSLLPERLRELGAYTAIRLLSQRAQRRLVRSLVREHGVEVVHEPVPIAARAPSLLHDLGAPVIVGPLNGDLDDPPALRRARDVATGLVIRLARKASAPLHRLLPGKLEAAVVLVTNERTRRALPPGVRGRVVPLVANAIDTSLWRPREEEPAGPIRFVTLGRFVDFKAFDVLIEAFAPVADRIEARLVVVGDGPRRPRLQALARRLGVADRVEFPGWLAPEDAVERLRRAHVFAFPSLRDPGGAAVVEALGVGLPLICTDWGAGPEHMNGEEAGLLVAPTSREDLVRGFTDAMLRLGRDGALRRRMARTARERGRSFDWSARVERLIELYEETGRGSAAGPTAARGPTDRAPAA